MSHPFLNTLLECHQQLVLFVRNNLGDVSLFLRQKNIIDQEMFLDVSNPQASSTDDVKAKVVVRALQKKVEEDETYFDIFLKQLIEKYPDSKITGLLQSAVRTPIQPGASSTAAEKKLEVESLPTLDQLIQLAYHATGESGTVIVQGRNLHYKVKEGFKGGKWIHRGEAWDSEAGITCKSKTEGGKGAKKQALKDLVTQLYSRNLFQ